MIASTVPTPATRARFLSVPRRSSGPRRAACPFLVRAQVQEAAKEPAQEAAPSEPAAAKPLPVSGSHPPWWCAVSSP